MLNPKYRGKNFKFSTFDTENFVLGTSAIDFAKPLNKKEEEILKNSVKYTCSN